MAACMQLRACCGRWPSVLPGCSVLRVRAGACGNRRNMMRTVSCPIILMALEKHGCGIHGRFCGRRRKGASADRRLAAVGCSVPQCLPSHCDTLTTVLHDQRPCQVARTLLFSSPITSQRVVSENVYRSMRWNVTCILCRWPHERRPHVPASQGMHALRAHA